METFEAIKTKYETYSKEDLLDVISKLIADNALLRTMLFSAKKERTKEDPIGIPPLFNEVESESQAEESSASSNEELSPSDTEDAKNPDDKPKKGNTIRGKRKPLPPELPRVRQEFDLSEEDKICKIHNQPLIKIGEDIVEKLEIIPAKVQVVQQVTFKYKSPCCEKNFYSATKDPDPIPKSFASPSLLAYIATAKFVDGLPLYRQERIFERFSIDLNRTTAARWMIKMGELVQPLINLMHEDLMDSPVIHGDETEVQVLKEPDRAAESKSYMWCLARQSDQPIILFRYYTNRSKKAVEDLLAEFKGVLICDGYKAYNCLLIMTCCILAGCLAHVRRKFWQAEKIAKKEAKKGTEITASKAIAFIKKIYAIESEVKGKPPDEILKIRELKSAPILDEFLTWLKKTETAILPSSPTGKAIQYALGQWEKLTYFTKNGLVAVDNNFMEAHIRPFVIGRNAWMFCDTPKGADASANLYSLVESAKANGVDPHDYLCLIFKELPRSPTLSELEKLLPHRVKEHHSLKTYQLSK